MEPLPDNKAILINIKAGEHTIKIDPLDDGENRVLILKHKNDNKLKGTNTPFNQSKIRHVSLNVNVTAGERVYVNLHFGKVKGTTTTILKILGRPKLRIVEDIDKNSRKIRKIPIQAV